MSKENDDDEGSLSFSPKTNSDDLVEFLTLKNIKKKIWKRIQSFQKQAIFSKTIRRKETTIF